jgi:hypothetical protein
MIRLVSPSEPHMIQLTDAVDPQERLSTQYGVLDTATWMAREVARITRDPRRIAEVRTDEGKVSVWVDCQSSDCCGMPRIEERRCVSRG